MTWRREWHALSARIRGLTEGAEFFCQARITDSSDPYSIGRKVLIPQATALIGEMESFRERHGATLPERAAKCIGRLYEVRPYLEESLDAAGRAIFIVTFLTQLRTEFEYLIADHSAVARSLTERAFSHLQRSLIADAELRSRWRTAFEEQREEEIERLGFVHLLLHGIWAFKAHAVDPAGRTDLVLNAPIQSGEVERSSEALVLTEWKKLKAGENASAKADVAQAQAHIYSGGVLGGFELRDTRYLVLVSERELAPIPGDRKDGDITYRVVPIVIEPSLPSVAARRASRRSE